MPHAAPPPGVVPGPLHAAPEHPDRWASWSGREAKKGIVRQSPTQAPCSSNTAGLNVHAVVRDMAGPKSSSASLALVPVPRALPARQPL